MASVSFAIATLNSDKTLFDCLSSIFAQSIAIQPSHVLIIDGGSNDNTLSIASNFACTIIQNPLVEPGYAKYIGYVNCKTEFLVFHDSDEILTSRYSVENKIYALIESGSAIAISSGYLPSLLNFTSQYINEYGDPFSFYLYHSSKHPTRWEHKLRTSFETVQDRPTYISFSGNRPSTVLIEAVAMSTMISMSIAKKLIPELEADPRLVPHFFYLINKQIPTFCYMKNDGILHKPSTSFSSLLRKIRSRVIANIYFTNNGSGESGLTGRLSHQRGVILKVYLFPLYLMSIIFPIYDTIKECIKRNEFSFIIHFLLLYYTGLLIAYYTIRKLLKFDTQNRKYG